MGKLFGGVSRVKLMRLFLFSPDVGFDLAEITGKAKVPKTTARKELNFFFGIKFIKKGKVAREVKRKKGKKVIVKKIKLDGWFLNKNFDYINSLHDILIESKFLHHGEVLKRFKNTGNIKLLIISGVFIKNDDTNVDILIVGDSLKRWAIEHALRQIEAEIGKELRYGVFETQDFMYRLDMYDKFIRNILDYPHERLIEKIRVE